MNENVGASGFGAAIGGPGREHMVDQYHRTGWSTAGISDAIVSEQEVMKAKERSLLAQMHGLAQHQLQQPTGTKYDSEKPPMHLLDAEALEGLARVLEFGRNKYAADNWRGGLSYTRLLGALLRHTFAILRGEDVDSESGLPHVDHLGCCWMFLSNMMKTRPDMDDRWKGKNARHV